MPKQFLAFRSFVHDKGDFVTHDEGYEKLQIKTPDGTQARIYYVAGAHSTEPRMGFKLETEDREWIEEFFFCPLDPDEITQWENTTEFMHQLYLGGLPYSSLKPFR